jgi:hypothetical protein
MESLVVEIDGSEKLVPLRKDGSPLLVGRSRTAHIRLLGRSISGSSCSGSRTIFELISFSFLTAIHGELYLQPNGGLLFVDKSKAGCSLNGQYFINKSVSIFPGDEILVGTQSTGTTLRLVHMNMARPSFPDDRDYSSRDGKDASYDLKRT